jgi:hypothetical protein
MYCQILTFTIDEMADDGYARVCIALREECTALPALTAQRWSVNATTHVLSGILRWEVRESLSMSRARAAVEHMAAALYLSPPPVAEREIHLPARATMKPATPRATFTDDHDPRG